MGVWELKYEWARFVISWADPLCDLDPCLRDAMGDAKMGADELKIRTALIFRSGVVLSNKLIRQQR